MPDPAIIRELEALRVGPDEVLVVRVPDNPDREAQAVFDDLSEMLVHVGLGDRSLIFVGDVEFGVAKRNPEEEPA